MAEVFQVCKVGLLDMWIASYGAPTSFLEECFLRGSSKPRCLYNSWTQCLWYVSILASEGWDSSLGRWPLGGN